MEDLGKYQQRFYPVRGISQQPEAFLKSIGLPVEQRQKPDTLQWRAAVGEGTLDRLAVQNHIPKRGRVSTPEL